MSQTIGETEHGRFTWDGSHISIRTCKYMDGTTGVMLREAVSNEPVAILSLNLNYLGEDAALPENEFWGKDYSENAEIFDAMVRIGLIEPTGRTIQVSQWVEVQSWQLT